MWRSYKQFYRHQYNTQVHFFPGIHEYPEGGSRIALCGKKAMADYVEPMLIGPLKAMHYCKKCDAALKRKQKG